MTKIWLAKTKRGETYGRWYACVTRPNGHIYKTMGGFACEVDAANWAESTLKEMASD